MAVAWRQLVEGMMRLAACACMAALTMAPVFGDVSGDSVPPPAEAKAPSATPPPAEPASPAQTKSEPNSSTSPQPAKSPLDDMPSYGQALVRMVVVLVSILIALFLLARFLPRWLGKPMGIGRGEAIKVVDSIALEARKRIYLIKVGEQFFLVGTSETGVHMLSDKAIDAATLPAKLSDVTSASADASIAAAGPGGAMHSFAAALSKQTPQGKSEGAR